MTSVNYLMLSIFSSGWKSVVFGLKLKMVATWLIFPSMFIPIMLPSHLGLMFAALLLLIIDLIGRCFCARAPVNNENPIMLSIVAQSVGTIGLVMFSVSAGGIGIVAGITLAIACQIFAATLFIAHLKMIALDIQEPTIAAKIDQLPKRLFTTTWQAVGCVLMAMVVSPVAFFVALFPTVGVFIALLLVCLTVGPMCLFFMVNCFTMLCSYERSLSELRTAIYSQGR